MPLVGQTTRKSDCLQTNSLPRFFSIACLSLAITAKISSEQVDQTSLQEAPSETPAALKLHINEINWLDKEAWNKKLRHGRLDPFVLGFCVSGFGASSRSNSTYALQDSEFSQHTALHEAFHSLHSRRSYQQILQDCERFKNACSTDTGSRHAYNELMNFFSRRYTYLGRCVDHYLVGAISSANLTSLLSTNATEACLEFLSAAQRSRLFEILQIDSKHLSATERKELLTIVACAPPNREIFAFKEIAAYAHGQFMPYAQPYLGTVYHQKVIQPELNNFFLKSSSGKRFLLNYLVEVVSDNPSSNEMRLALSTSKSK